MGTDSAAGGRTSNPIESEMMVDVVVVVPVGQAVGENVVGTWDGIELEGDAEGTFVSGKQQVVLQLT